MSTRDFNRDWALRLGEIGLSVFPCNAEKKPLCKWRAESTAEAQRIAEFWAQNPGALPAIDLAKAGLVVLDGDRHGGPDGVSALVELCAEHGLDRKEHPIIKTPNDGLHLYCRQNGDALTNSRGGLPPGVDVRGHGGYVVAPNASLPDGRRWTPDPNSASFFKSITEGTIPLVPGSLVGLIKRPEPPPTDNNFCRSGAREEKWARAALDGLTAQLAGMAPETGRNERLNKCAYRLGKMVARDWLSRAEVEHRLIAAAYANQLVKNTGARSVQNTIKSGIEAGLREPHPDLEERAEAKRDEKPAPASASCAITIDETLAVFERWLILEDVTPVLAVLGTIAANLLPGDPVWLGLIGPPSSAKTEILNSVARLPYVVQAATVTPAGLLSGTPKKQRDKDAKGGLLRQIDEFGILSLKDFGSILSMRPDAKAEILAALREIYDGAWTRHLGTDGGRKLEWKGKVGMIFAATGVIDAHYSVIGAMGDRFLLSRLAPAGKGQFGRALQHLGAGTKQMRAELAECVTQLFAGRQPEPRPITEDEIGAIDDIISLVVRMRGAVDRDRQSREIEAVYGAEGTARIGLTLERLLAGLDTLGVDRTTAMSVVKAVALDSVPPLRRRAYQHLCKAQTAVETPAVARAIDLPTNTVRRALEDLAAYQLVERIVQGAGRADQWRALVEEA